MAKSVARIAPGGATGAEVAAAVNVSTFTCDIVAEGL